MKRSLIIMVASFFLMYPILALGQPITFPSSMSVGEEQFIGRVQPWYERSTDDPSGAGRELIDWSTPLFGMYGLSEKTALFGRISYIKREFNDGNQTHTDRGISDLELFARHTVIEKNWPRRTFSVSPYVGVELPTGDDTSAGLPRGRTLGSGSMDYLVGFAVRDATLSKPHRFLNMEYKWNREHGGFERGDEFEINGAIKPPLADWETPDGELIGVNGMLEANFHWQDHHEQNGTDVSNTGGTSLFVTPGLVYTRHRTIFEFAVQIPVVQNLHGAGLENDYNILVGLWKNF